jgi:hypothetical protein
MHDHIACTQVLCLWNQTQGHLPGVLVGLQAGQALLQDLAERGLHGQRQQLLAGSLRIRDLRRCSHRTMQRVGHWSHRNMHLRRINLRVMHACTCTHAVVDRWATFTSRPKAASATHSSLQKARGMSRTGQLLVPLGEHGGASAQLLHIKRQQLGPLLRLHTLPEGAHRRDPLLWQHLQLLLWRGTGTWEASVIG